MTHSIEHRIHPERQVKGYLLSDEEMQKRVNDLLEERPPETDDQIVCYEINKDELDDVARTVERVVFEKRFGNTAEDMARIYGPYEHASTFFLSVDQVEKKPAGALRVIGNSLAGNMTLNDVFPKIIPLEVSEVLNRQGMESLDDCWDIGTVAVMPEYRRQGKGVSLQLYRAMHNSAIQHGIEHITAILDEEPYETMTKYLGIPFVPIAQTDSFKYEGSDNSYAVYGHIPDLAPSVRRKGRTLRGLMARKAIRPLGHGTIDHTIMLNSDDKK